MLQWVRTLFLIGFCLVGGLSARAETIKITDLAGRQVSLETPVERLVISEGRYLSLLALLQPSNPVRGVVGMMTPLGWLERVPSYKDQQEKQDLDHFLKQNKN